MHGITLSLYTSFNSRKHSVRIFSISQEISDALLEFLPSHISGRATQHGHTQTKFIGKPTDIETWVQSCLIWEGSRSITFRALPAPTSFPSTVRGVPLFFSHTSCINTIILKWRLIRCGNIQLTEILILMLWYLKTIRPFWTYLMNILQHLVYNLSNTAAEFSMVIIVKEWKLWLLEEQNQLKQHGLMIKYQNRQLF
jgi:hypothetical protein